MAARFATVAEVRSLLGSSYDDPAVTDAQIQGILDDLGCIMNVCAWGECLSVGSKYAAAHWVALGPGKAAGIQPPPGVLAAMKDGPASVSFGVTAAPADDTWWAMSSWGLQYLEFRKTVRGVGPFVLGVTARTRRPGW